MNRVEHIEINLNSFKISLKFQNLQDPLILHFDTPSRKFYLALIALIVHEMRQKGDSGHVYIREFENQLKFLDKALAGSHASETIDGMWEKIRKAWRYSLPNLEEAAHFKIEGRDLRPPYEKGGKFLYECTQDESDAWTSLFGIDDITSKWNFGFALYTPNMSVPGVIIKYEELRNDSAWKAFFNQLEQASSKELSDDEITEVIIGPATRKEWYYYASLILVVMVLIVGGMTILNRHFRQKQNLADVVSEIKASIVVLPFSNTSDDPNKDFFCDGITEDLISNLARVKDIRVISSKSSFYYKNKDCDLRTIGQSLDIDHALEGSVRVSGDRVRISAQLIRVTDDSHVWADSYDFLLGDLFSIIDDINIKILTAVQVKVTAGDRTRGLAKGTNSVEAFLNCMQGLHFQQKNTSPANIEAEKFYRRAIEIDPNYATPYIMLAFVNLNKRILLLTDNPDDTLKQAFELAKKGMSIDPEHPEGYLALGRAYQQAGQADKAKETYKRCIEINPNYARGYFRLGRIYVVSNQPEIALSLYKKAIKLDPLIFPRGLPGAYIAMERYEDAIKDLKFLLRRYPNHPLLMYQIIASYAGIDNLKKARYYADKLLAINPKFSVSKWKKSRRALNPEYVKKYVALMRKAGLPE